MINLKAIVIGLAITILTSFVAIYGIQAFYGEQPQWDDYCKDIVSPGYEINTSAECEAFEGAKWNSYYENTRSVPAPIKGTPNGYCDLYYDCNKKLEEESKNYSKTVFIISVPIGVVLIALGGIFFVLESVGVGIMLGGVVTLIYGAQTYWPNAGSMGRFLISLVGLIFLIILAYWLNKKEQKKWWMELFFKR